MNRVLSSLLLIVFAILALAIPAEAQPGRARSITRAIAGKDSYGGGYRRGGYDSYGYDPYGPRDGRDFFGRKLPPIEIEECEYVECYGRKGTFHSEMGATHFRMNDSTHNPFNMNHKNCIVIKSIGQTTVQSSDQSTPSVGSAEATSAPQSVSGPVDPLASMVWPTVNTTDFRAVVTDPNLPESDPRKHRLLAGRGSMSLPEPAGVQPYTVVLVEPGRGKSTTIPGEILPSKDLQGWEILAREEK